MSPTALLSILVLSAGATVLEAQAITEFGTLAGRSAAATGAAASGKSMADVFGKLGQTLGAAAKTGEAPPPKPVSAVTSTATPAANPQPTPAPHAPADLSALAIGMDRADLLRKAGKPAMTISSVEDSTMVETCWYRSGPDNVTVVLRDGKVASISGPMQTAPR